MRKLDALAVALLPLALVGSMLAFFYIGQADRLSRIDSQPVELGVLDSPDGPVGVGLGGVPQDGVGPLVDDGVPDEVPVDHGGVQGDEEPLVVVESLTVTPVARPGGISEVDVPVGGVVELVVDPLEDTLPPEWRLGPGWFMVPAVLLGSALGLMAGMGLSIVVCTLQAILDAKKERESGDEEYSEHG